MFNDSAVEFIELEHYDLGSIDYQPTFISGDKRMHAGGTTSIGQWDIGSSGHQGNMRSPIFKVTFVDISAVTATHIKVWGIGNDNNDAAIFPKTYLVANPELSVYLRKFEFTNGAGTVVAPGGAYTIIGSKKKVMPLNY